MGFLFRFAKMRARCMGYEKIHHDDDTAFRHTLEDAPYAEKVQYSIIEKRTICAMATIPRQPQQSQPHQAQAPALQIPQPQLPALPPNPNNLKDCATIAETRNWIRNIALATAIMEDEHKDAVANACWVDGPQLNDMSIDELVGCFRELGGVIAFRRRVLRGVSA